MTDRIEIHMKEVMHICNEMNISTVSKNHTTCKTDNNNEIELQNSFRKHQNYGILKYIEFFNIIIYKYITY